MSSSDLGPESELVIERLQAERETLLAALRTYGQHKSSCGHIASDLLCHVCNGSAVMHCICGWVSKQNGFPSTVTLDQIAAFRAQTGIEPHKPVCTCGLMAALASVGGGT